MTDYLGPILEQIRCERDYQDGKWGKEFDDKNTINDWAAYINIYLSHSTVMGATPLEQRNALLKVAALAVAALETDSRNEGLAKRHYDE